jgi:catechol-2,3-dioxygenase
MRFPILATRDLAGLLGFYRDLLGFSVTPERALPPLALRRRLRRNTVIIGQR